LVRRPSIADRNGAPSRLLPLARLLWLGVAFTPPRRGRPQKGGAIVTVYRHNSHAD